MKKRLFLLSFFTMIVLGAGCASSAPVSTVESDQILSMPVSLPQAGSVEEVLVAHIKKTLDAVVSGDVATLGALPEPESSRLEENREFQLKWDPKYRVLDYGVSAEIWGEAPASTAGGVLVVSEGVAWLDSDGHYYAQEIHRLTLEGGRVIKDEYIGEDHPEFDKLRLLKPARRIDIKSLPSSPWNPVR